GLASVQAAIIACFSVSLDQLEILILMDSPAPLTFCVDATNRTAGGACALTDTAPSTSTATNCHFVLAISVLIFLLGFLTTQTARHAIDLIAGLNLARESNLRRRGRLRINIRDGTREATQRALGRRVLDAALFHDARHELHEIGR